ncbi:MAG: putative DNA binding domain-containing protein [Clostridiales bacterium]|jgi:predicted HTH transcriptional regulator|nr:putative DNA binding domain-containing protein [Clostridiales bacterium]
MIDFDKLHTYKENNRLEVKRAAGGLPNSIWSTYSAFANTNGGVILLGVEENADKTLKIAGLADPEKLVSDFWNTVNNRSKVNINILRDADVQITDLKGKKIIIITIPRATRTERPVFLNNHHDNTFRRDGEGDYRCSKEEILSMLRDNAIKTQDMLVLEHMDNRVFNYDTVKAYRNRMKLSRPDHVWEGLPDDEFLYKLGAIGLGESKERHPTAAGLLMFGNDYEIVHEYGNYFLDYQEQIDLDIRWTDRIYSSTGEWSGNICDFYFKVINRLSQTLKVPFVLVGDTRIDDTPIHKAVREALVNSLVNSDYYGRCGLVIKRRPNEITFENPGGFRVPIDLAISGGISDPRNSVLMKMFNLLNIGERAGSGIPNIFYVWHKEDLGVPQFEETMNSSRTKLTLPIKPTSDISIDNQAAKISEAYKKYWI